MNAAIQELLDKYDGQLVTAKLLEDEGFINNARLEYLKIETTLDQMLAGFNLNRYNVNHPYVQFFLPIYEKVVEAYQRLE